MLNSINTEIDIHQIMKYMRHENINLPDFDISIKEYIYEPKYPEELDAKRVQLDCVRPAREVKQNVSAQKDRTRRYQPFTVSLIDTRFFST